MFLNILNIGTHYNTYLQYNIWYVGNKDYRVWKKKNITCLKWGVCAIKFLKNKTIRLPTCDFDSLLYYTSVNFQVWTKIFFNVSK